MLEEVKKHVLNTQPHGNIRRHLTQSRVHSSTQTRPANRKVSSLTSALQCTDSPPPIAPHSPPKHRRPALQIVLRPRGLSPASTHSTSLHSTTTHRRDVSNSTPPTPYHLRPRLHLEMRGSKSREAAIPPGARRQQPHTSEH